MGRKVVTLFVVPVNQVEAHVFYSVLRRCGRIAGLDRKVIAAIDSERPRGVERAEIERG